MKKNLKKQGKDATKLMNTYFLEIECLFGKNYFCQFILLFSLFLLSFMGLTALFGIIHGLHCTILGPFGYSLFLLKLKTLKQNNF